MTAYEKFANDLSRGLNEAFGMSTTTLTPAQYAEGHIMLTETVYGGPAKATAMANAIKRCSEAVTSVRSVPFVMGDPAMYSFDIEFDRSIAESVYSDGKNTIASLEKDGKKYIVTDNGSATEVEDPDKYVDNLNKTTGSRFKKTEDFNISLQELIDLANTALDGTGVNVALDGSEIKVSGEEGLVKATQQFLPAPVDGFDGLEGGYDDESKTVVIVLDEFPDTRDRDAVQEYLNGAVNYILDNYCANPEKEWADDLEAAVADDTLAEKYAYMGEDFATDRKAQCALVKSVARTDYSEAYSLAVKFMGKKLAESLMPKYKPQVSEALETKKAAPRISEEMGILDNIHESMESKVPEQICDLDAILNRNRM